MILTIDIGNSNIVSVLYDDEGAMLFTDRQETIKEENYRRYRTFFEQLNENFDQEALTVITTSCVVPYIRSCVREVLRDMYPHAERYQLQTELVPDMKIMLKEPRELGADIIATSYGAFHKYQQPTIVADLGSATKISVVDEDKTFLGGIIMPGIAFQARSLHQMIPHLPEMEITKPDSIIGHDTMTSIQSGIINGTLAATIELAKEIEEELGRACTWVITGGLAKLFTATDLEGYVYDEFLLNDGLYHLSRTWMAKNRKK